MKSKIYISVINDLVTDQRVHRIATTISAAGYEVTLIGRKLRKSKKFKPSYAYVKRFNLLINKGFLFYACYNINLFFYLLFQKGPMVLISNDLDTLPANFLVSRLKRAKLVYDSHEYFTEVPELEGRKFVKQFWTLLERFLVPKVDVAYTVNESLAKMYSAKYGIEFGVIRNIPDNLVKEKKYSLPEEFENNGFIIYQGAINKDRGLEDVMELIGEEQQLRMVIAGDGDIMESLKTRAGEIGIRDRVLFTGSLKPARLKSLTKKARLGISLEKKTNLNYYYALPNKLFDYIHAGIPVLCSGFPEMRKIVEHYEVGMIVDPGKREEIKQALKMMFFDMERQQKWRENAKLAAEELTWKTKQKKIADIFKKAGLNLEQVSD